MGDYTQLQVMIYDCPDEQAWALSGVLEDFELHVDWDGPVAERGELHIGTLYTAREAAGDAPDYLGEAMQKAAPLCSFKAWTDPAYDWLGLLVRYTPALGRHSDECDSNGQAVFFEGELTEWVRRGTVPLLEYIGAPWSTVFENYREQRTITTTEPDDQ